MSAGSLPGRGDDRRDDPRDVRVVVAVGCGARLVFRMIFVWELRVPAKQMVARSVCRWVR